MPTETIPGVLIIIFGVWGLVLYAQQALRREKSERLLAGLIAVVCLAAALGWSYALGTGRLLDPTVGRSILALALAALVWLELARGGRHGTQ